MGPDMSAEELFVADCAKPTSESPSFKKKKKKKGEKRSAQRLDDSPQRSSVEVNVQNDFLTAFSDSSKQKMKRDNGHSENVANGLEQLKKSKKKSKTKREDSTICETAAFFDDGKRNHHDEKSEKKGAKGKKLHDQTVMEEKFQFEEAHRKGAEYDGMLQLSVSGFDNFGNGLGPTRELKKRQKIDSNKRTIHKNAFSHDEKSDHCGKTNINKGNMDKTWPCQMPMAEKFCADDLSRRLVEDDEMLQVNVSGVDAHNAKYRPFQSFLEVSAPEVVMKCCSGFAKPFPIQAYGWPYLLDGRSLIGIATTGSGKTLAFGVPALVHVLNRAEKELRGNFPTCLVLSPTRELAQQISEVLIDAGHSCGVRTSCFYGGISKKPQYTALKSGVDIIVATPGRLQDLVEEGRCMLRKVSFVVLDEADRMLDLGFEETVRALISQTSKSRQTIMFSATWPPAVDLLAKEFIGDTPIKVTVGPKDVAANHSVTQIVEVIDSSLRDGRLLEVLKKYHKSERSRILVFVLYKKEAVRVENMLRRKGWNVSAVHGDLGQMERNKSVLSFKNGTCPLLIATDVAARGLDIPDVEYVLNYSFPLTTEDYVHRIGRTGRAGKTGIAHTFFTSADKARAGELVNVLKQAGQTVPLELMKFGTSVKKKESKLYGAHYKEVCPDAPKSTRITFESDEE